MDWNLAISRNRDQLRQIILALFALAGLRPHRALPVGPDGKPLFTLSRSAFAAIMAILRPAESCVRRLILIAAHGIVVKREKPRDFVIPAHRAEYPLSARPVGVFPTPAFRLLDPLKSSDPESIWDVDPKWDSGFDFTHMTGQENPSEPIPATHLGQRLNALIRALDSIPHQARRLIRWQAKRDALLKASKPTRLSPIRPGLPPGWRERKIHEIDDVLRECHGLAGDRLNEPDSS